MTELEFKIIVFDEFKSILYVSTSLALIIGQLTKNKTILVIKILLIFIYFFLQSFITLLLYLLISFFLHYIRKRPYSITIFIFFQYILLILYILF